MVERKTGWHGPVRLLMFAIAVIFSLVIWFWPTKTGDLRFVGGKPELYWRGPDPAEPGRWLPRSETVDPNTVIECRAVRRRTVLVSDMRVVDCVPLGSGKCLIVLDDGTAAIVNSQ